MYGAGGDLESQATHLNNRKPTPLLATWIAKPVTKERYVSTERDSFKEAVAEKNIKDKVPLPIEKLLGVAEKLGGVARLFKKLGKDDTDSLTPVELQSRLNQANFKDALSEADYDEIFHLIPGIEGKKELLTGDLRRKLDESSLKISGVTAKKERYCARHFLAETYADQMDSIEPRDRCVVEPQQELVDVENLAADIIHEDEDNRHFGREAQIISLPFGLSKTKTVPLVTTTRGLRVVEPTTGGKFKALGRLNINAIPFYTIRSQNLAALEQTAAAIQKRLQDPEMLLKAATLRQKQQDLGRINYSNLALPQTSLVSPRLVQSTVGNNQWAEPTAISKSPSSPAIIDNFPVSPGGLVSPGVSLSPTAYRDLSGAAHQVDSPASPAPTASRRLSSGYHLDKTSPTVTLQVQYDNDMTRSASLPQAGIVTMPSESVGQHQRHLKRGKKLFALGEVSAKLDNLTGASVNVPPEDSTLLADKDPYKTTFSHYYPSSSEMTRSHTVLGDADRSSLARDLRRRSRYARAEVSREITRTRIEFEELQREVQEQARASHNNANQLKYHANTFVSDINNYAKFPFASTSKRAFPKLSDRMWRGNLSNSSTSDDRVFESIYRSSFDSSILRTINSSAEYD